MKRIANVPSPAMAVAFVALLAALGGTAVALPGTNSVNSGDIKNGSVASVDIRNNSVRGGDIRNGTLTGADVSESSLGKVPSAGSADTAGRANTAGTATAAVTALNALNAGNSATTGGVAMVPVSIDVPDSSGFGPVTIQGVTFSGDCNGGDFNVDVANGSGQQAALRVSGSADGAFYQTGDDDFTSGDFDSVIPDDADVGQVTAQIGFADGTSTTLLLGYSNGAVFDATSCRIWGQALRG